MQMLKAKAGITVVVLTLAAGGGTYIYKNFDKLGKNSSFGDFLKTVNLLNEISIMTEEEPNKLEDKDLQYSPYSSSSSFETNKDKFGGKYGRLLADAYSENDNDWWKQNLSKKKDKINQEDPTFKDFKNKTGEDSNISTEIKNKCKEVYQKDEKDINDKELFNTWLLCSPLNNIPHNVIGFRLKYLNKFATSDQNNNLLLEDRPSNKNAWEALYEKFVKTTNDGKAGTTTQAKTTQFQNITIGYKKEGDTPKEPSAVTVLVSDTVKEKALNQVCSEAYTKTKEEIEKSADYKHDIMNFCTITTVSSS